MTAPATPLTSTSPHTFLFTDIEGSTKLWEQHPEAMQAALARHDALLHTEIAAAWTEGKTLTLDAAVAAVLGETK